MAWLPPELEMGEEPELKPVDPELELELDEPELDPVELDPEEAEPELEPAEDEPEPAEDELEDPVEAEPVELVACAEPGRAKARAPAVTTLAMVTTVVVDRTLLWPRSLAAVAWRILSSRLLSLLMSLILRSRTRESLHEPSA